MTLKAVVGPTVEEVMKATCPEDKPFKCLPYGMCYNYGSFCSLKSRTVEPCFPETVMDKQADLFTLCSAKLLNPDSSFVHSSCQLFCQLIVSSGTTSNVLETTDSYSAQQTQTELILICGLLMGWFVCGSVVCTVVLFFKRCQLHSVKQLKFKDGVIIKKEKSSENNGKCSRNNDWNLEQEELIGLEPNATCDSCNIHELPSIKSAYEKFEGIPTEELQVVIGDTETDIVKQRLINSQKRLPEFKAVVDVERSSETSYPFMNLPYDQYVLDDTDLPIRCVHDVNIHDEQDFSYE